MVRMRAKKARRAATHFQEEASDKKPPAWDFSLVLRALHGVGLTMGPIAGPRNGAIANRPIADPRSAALNISAMMPLSTISNTDKIETRFV
jgi:hypothetical protein